MTSRPRRTLPGIVLAALLLTLAACGGTSAPDAASSAPSPTASTGATVTHKFGTTTVPANPTRVVTVGFNEQDFAIALGTEPVGGA